MKGFFKCNLCVKTNVETSMIKNVFDFEYHIYKYVYMYMYICMYVYIYIYVIMQTSQLIAMFFNLHEQLQKFVITFYVILAGQKSTSMTDY